MTNVDEELAEGQAKKEDLRVEQCDWIALYEVKGHTEGAKLSDLSSLERFAALYAAETGQLPGGMWYVVNQFREDRPEQSTAAASRRRRVPRDVRIARRTRHRYARSVPVTKSG